MSSWTFDGRGVNGSDEYRTRLATLSQAATPAAGRLMAAAPDLLEAVQALLAMPEFDGTRGTSIRRRAVKTHARNVLRAVGALP